LYGRAKWGLISAKLLIVSLYELTALVGTLGVHVGARKRAAEAADIWVTRNRPEDYGAELGGRAA
jgi:hypothetical protein